MPAESSEGLFWRRSLRYARLHRDVRICGRTAFFAAASVVTRAFAYAPATAFMCGLSLRLEQTNLARAASIRRGELYAGGTIARNTADFIRVEQCLVQIMLDALRAHDARGYAAEIAQANEGLANLRHGCARFRSLAHWRLSRAISRAHAVLLQFPDFSRQEDRQILGLAIAAEATGLPVVR